MKMKIELSDDNFPFNNGKEMVTYIVVKSENIKKEDLERKGYVCEVCELTGGYCGGSCPGVPEIKFDVLR